MQGFRASEWGNEGFLKDDGKDGLRPMLFIIHEVNLLIEWLKLETDTTIAHFPAFEPSFAEHGIYIPAIIQSKIVEVWSLLQQIDESL
jgi:hypothetical protein